MEAIFFQEIQQVLVPQVLSLVKTNSTGDTLWTKVFSGIYGGVGYSVQQTVDGGYVILGYT